MMGRSEGISGVWSEGLIGPVPPQSDEIRSSPESEIRHGHTGNVLLRRRPIFDRRKEPGFGIAPGAIDAAFGQIEQIRNFCVAESYEEPQLHHLGLEWIDRGEFDESFRCYKRGNAIRKVQHRHHVKINVFNTARQMKTLTAEFFAERRGWGCPAPDPIFIVGLPRAGSTLLEQILASHSEVQGTAGRVLQAAGVAVPPTVQQLP